MITNVKNPEDEKYWTERPYDDIRRDWNQDAGNWIEDYVGSKSHPHREELIQAIGHLEPFESVLEVGCNAGPNIELLRERFTYLKDQNLFGVDVNLDAIFKARERMPAVTFLKASATNLPFRDNTFDIVFTDAVLIYLNPTEIKKAISEIERVARKAVVLVEWYDWWSTWGRIKDFHWARNYERIFKRMGFKVEKIKITEKQWPSANWTRNGYIFVCRRELPISDRNS